jgi:SAM-dependent methyltransferase
MDIDFGKTASDYARHRAGFPVDFFDRLFRDNIVKPADRILDLGTGTGTLARSFAQRGCDEVGLDPSAPLLEQAERLDKEAGVSVPHVRATAEQTGLGSQSFDIVSAGQCWHWFARLRAAAEAHRLLVPGGCLLIAHFDWLPLPGNVVVATETLIRKHNPSWGNPDGIWGFAHGRGIYPKWFADLSLAGFGNIESFSFDVRVPYSHEAWLGRIRASAGVAASLPPEAVAQFDVEHRELLKQRFPEDPLQIPHRVFAVWGRKPYTRMSLEELGSR